jgi:DNA-binding transcriptional MerR regulator
MATAKKATIAKELAPRREALPKGLRENLYTAPELMRLTGMTRKQVTYWARIGLLKPKLRDLKARPGQPGLFYSTVEIIKALIICDLRRAGFTPRQVQQVARNLEKQGIRLDESQAYILTDGYSVYYASSDNEVVDLLKHHRQMLLLVPLREQLERLKKAA